MPYILQPFLMIYNLYGKYPTKHDARKLLIICKLRYMYYRTA